jgi:hypothetical protein
VIYPRSNHDLLIELSFVVYLVCVNFQNLFSFCSLHVHSFLFFSYKFSLVFPVFFSVFFSLIFILWNYCRKCWSKLKLNLKALFDTKMLNTSFLPSHQGSCSMLTSSHTHPDVMLFLTLFSHPLSIQNSHTAWWMASTNEISENADKEFHFSVHGNSVELKNFEPAIVRILLKCTHTISFVLNWVSASANPFFFVFKYQVSSFSHSLLLVLVQ